MAVAICLELSDAQAKGLRGFAEEALISIAEVESDPAMVKLGAAHKYAAAKAALKKLKAQLPKHEPAK